MPMAARPDLAAGWMALPFAECVTTEGIERRPTIQQTAYQSTGRFPVVDQGATFIAGYTDDESSVHQRDLPLILFGDHTRIFKFLDFPFATGADGTKLLRANQQLVVPRFLYYALRHLDIPGRGYARHFSYLRDVKIVAPDDRNEQLSISAVLSLVERYVILQDRLVTSLQDLKAATMAKLFREGLRGEPVQETEAGACPLSWKVRPIASLGQVITGTTPPTGRVDYYGGDVPFISPGDLGTNRSVRSTARTLSRTGLAVARPLPPRTVLVVCIGATIGKVGMTMAPLSSTNQQLNAIICNDAVCPEFLHYLMAWNAKRIKNLSTPSPVPLLSKNAFIQGRVALTADRVEQDDIATILCAIDDRLEMAASRHESLLTLFSSMLRVLITGQVQVPPELIGRLGGEPGEGQNTSAKDEQPKAASERGKPDEAVLQEIVRRIVAAVAPERIILFGSAARGEMGPDSDLDLLVVKACERRREVATTIYRALRGLGGAKDIVVVTPEDVERHRDTIGYILRPALREGRILYAA